MILVIAITQLMVYLAKSTINFQGRVFYHTGVLFRRLFALVGYRLYAAVMLLILMEDSIDIANGQLVIEVDGVV